MKALILGSSGQLGWQCMRDFPMFGVDVYGVNRSQLDVLNSSESDWYRVLKSSIESFQPDWIINAMAYTAVDRAEDEPQLAMQVNAEFPGFLATAIRKLSSKCSLLHCSTDYVFDGKGTVPFCEDDPTNPLSVYGVSKRQGELAALTSFDRSWVLRFSWVVGEHGQNFAKTMIRLACERDQLRVVDDQIGVPTPTPFLVNEFLRLMKRVNSDNVIEAGPVRRLFHVVPSGETTWHAYAQWCVAAAMSHPQILTRLRLGWQDIHSIQTKDYPSKALRPLNGRLDCSAWCAWHEIQTLPPWTTEASEVISRIIDRAALSA